MLPTQKQRACLQHRDVRFVIDDKHGETLKRILESELPPSVISDLVGFSINLRAEYSSVGALPEERAMAKTAFIAKIDSILK